jgi:serine/threonine-protein kinase
MVASAAALAPDFQLQREIGRGGMGVVYLALDVKLDRPVAIKVLPPHLAGSEEVRARFLREARTAAKLSHPNIVPVFRADEMKGVVFFVMAYIDGESLADRLARCEVFTPMAGARLLRDVAIALDYAHGRGIVHRDVKPENILLERDTDRPMVTDFGIARLAEAAPLTATGQVLGTVHYMSPEQVSGEPLDGRSDLYSLGVVAFRMFSGRLPFDSSTASAVLVAHVTKAPPHLRDVAPRVPGALDTVIEGCLAKDPGARYQSGRALAAALDDAIGEIERIGQNAVAAPVVVSEREAQEIWARAAQLQAQTGAQSAVTPVPVRTRPAPDERRTLTSGYRLTDVQAAAQEAGISERHIARAASELGLAPAPLGTDSPSSIANRAPPASPWSGAPMSISYEVAVPGEVPESEYFMLVEIIRRRIGDPGHVNTLGRSLSWSISSKNRNLTISVIPRAGRTTIRVDERLGQLAGALFGGIVGGGGGGSVGFAIGIGTAVFHSLALAFGVWGAAIGGCYLLARSIFTSQVNKRARELRELLQDLSAQVQDSVTLTTPPNAALNRGPDGL